MGNAKSFDIKNLLPFHKGGSGVPGGIRGEEDKVAQVDPNLSPEEQIYVRHFLGYADILLASPPDELDSPTAAEDQSAEEKVIQMPRRSQEQPEPQENKKDDSDTEAA